jgi:hypothetical protein
MTQTSFGIRPTAEDDLADLLELYRHFNSGDPDPEPAKAKERFAAMLAQPGMTVFIGFADTAPVATATLIVIPNLTRQGASYALIENVVTHDPALYRRSLEGRLLQGHAAHRLQGPGNAAFL